MKNTENTRTLSKTEILSTVVDFFQRTGQGLHTSAEIMLKLATVAVEVVNAMNAADKMEKETGLRAIPKSETVEILSILQKKS